MIKLNLVNSLWIFYIIVSDYMIEGATVNETIPACSGTTVFQCRNEECIDAHQMCNGQADCTDYSDEDLDTCRHIPCSENLFHCSYGACVHGDAKCDGITDCADNSDEEHGDCKRVTCSRGMWTCKGGGCIDSLKLCNGVRDCADGSDETIDQCGSMPCTAFRCNYGACVSSGSDCNGIAECADGSDESPELCKNLFRPSASTHMCVLPPYPPYGTYNASRGFKPGDAVPFTILRYSCQSGYILQAGDLHSCDSGTWIGKAPTCGNCGIVSTIERPLSINAVPAEIGEFPWHVGLYHKTGTQIYLICGGTIFSPNLVVTAAHCVYNDQAGVYPASMYAVAAGKIYHRWNAIEDNDTYAQKINVRKIEVPENYRGFYSSYMADIAVLVLESSFQFNSLVRPVCIQFHKKDLVGKWGKVAGWGLTAENGKLSNILHTVTMPIVNYRECFDKSPESYRPLITFDKICAGYTNGTVPCKGDGGAGFVVARSNGDVDLHYLYAIISVSPPNRVTNSCYNPIFTSLFKHQEWFEHIWSSYNSIN